MSANGRRSTARWLLAGIAAGAVVGGAVAAADPDGSGPAARSSRWLAVSGTSSGASATSSMAPSTASGVGSGSCGAKSARMIAGVDAKVARRIYTGEITGREVEADAAHITGSRELLSALASSNTQAVYAAVHTIVYTPHWHIVRLRVVQRGHVLADVGGPYIIAPVTGSLRTNGRTVGSFTMSVQDDVGYVKLVSRFIGVPIDLYRSGSFLMGTLKPAPSSVSSGATVKVAGNSYLTQALDARAFPTGKLRTALFVSTPSHATTSQSCTVVRVAAWGNVVKHIAGRFSPLTAHYQDFVGTLQGSTAGLAYVRTGSTQLAGSDSGPARIPPHGVVKYRGRSWEVFSWAPFPPARIYFLTPGG